MSKRRVSRCRTDRNCWRRDCSGGECGEARCASWCERPSGEPRCEAVKVEGRGGCQVLQARLGQAAVACPAQAKGAHGLREGALNTVALRIQALALRRTLARPGGGSSLVLRSRHHRQDPALILRARLGAAGTRGTGPAVGGTEPHVNDAARPSTPGAACPTGTLLALGTAGDLVVPVHREIVQGERLAPAAALPAEVSAPRADQVDGVGRVRQRGGNSVWLKWSRIMRPGWKSGWARRRSAPV